MPDPVRDALPLRLLAGDRDKGQRPVDVRGRVSTTRQQREVNRPHPGADVEDGHALDAAFPEPVDQPGRRAGRTGTAKRPQAPARRSFPELVAAAAARGIAAGRSGHRQARTSWRMNRT